MDLLLGRSDRRVSEKRSISTGNCRKIYLTIYGRVPCITLKNTRVSVCRHRSQAVGVVQVIKNSRGLL